MQNPSPFTVLLFYKYVSLLDITEEQKAQKKICESLSLRGRVLIAKEGINATLCGTQEACDEYVKYMKAHPAFFDIDFKTSESSFMCFAKLHVKARENILNLGVTCSSPSGEYITPAELHTLLNNPPNDLVLLDARNAYESYVGKFEGAIAPQVNNFRDFPQYLENNQELFKDKDVIMYCTGGIRCEKSSALLVSLSCAKRVRQIHGGIHRYVEQFPNGFFKGRNYVFDDRVSMKINDHVLASCTSCKNKSDLYNNCLNALCNKHYVCCDACFAKSYGCCSSECFTQVQAKSVPVRPPLISRSNVCLI